MGRRQQDMDRAIRPKLRSPGHPKFQRPVGTVFWEAIAQGLLPEEASALNPVSPWQRGTNENTHGLLRQYFPKGTDLSRWPAGEIEVVAHALDTRPRKNLGWRTPTKALDEQLRSLQQASVATTG